jgi:hypothetical protein
MNRKGRFAEKLIIFVTLLILKSLLFGATITAISATAKSDNVLLTILTSEALSGDQISSWIDRDHWLNIKLKGVPFLSNDILSQEFQYPILDLSAKTIEESTLLSVHISKKITSFSILYFPKISSIQVAISWGNDSVQTATESEVSQSFVFPDPNEEDGTQLKHPKSWREARVRSYLHILCDTPDLPIYVDGQFVGKTPLENTVDVFPGWHKVGYFPGDPSEIAPPKTPKEKMLNDIVRMGILDVYVEEGKTRSVALSYQSLDEDVYNYQKKVNSGAWIGFGLFFITMLIISWGMV